MGIPNPGGIFPIPGVDLGVPDWANPFHWLNDQLKDLAVEAIKKLDDLLYAILRDTTHNFWAEFIYSESWGLAGYISVAIVYITLGMAILRKRFAKNFAQSVPIAILIGMFGMVWFTIIDNLIEVNLKLVRGVDGLFSQLPEQSGDSPIKLPEVINTAGSLLTYTFIVFFGGLLVVIFLCFSFEILIAKVVGLVILAVSSTSRIAREAWVFLVGMTLVAVIAGPTLAVFITKSIKWLTVHGPGRDETLVHSFYIIAGLVSADALVIGLIFLSYRKVSDVAGKIEAKVFGDVDADARIKEPVSTDQVNRTSLDTMRVPSPVPSTTNESVVYEQPVYSPNTNSHGSDSDVSGKQGSVPTTDRPPNIKKTEVAEAATVAGTGGFGAVALIAHQKRMDGQNSNNT